MIICVECPGFPTHPIYLLWLVGDPDWVLDSALFAGFSFCPCSACSALVWRALYMFGFWLFSYESRSSLIIVTRILVYIVLPCDFFGSVIPDFLSTEKYFYQLNSMLPLYYYISLWIIREKGSIKRIILNRKELLSSSTHQRYIFLWIESQG